MHKIKGLPGRLLNTGDLTFVGELTETNTAKIEITHVAVSTTTFETTTNDARTEFRFLLRTDDN